MTNIRFFRVILSLSALTALLAGALPVGAGAYPTAGSTAPVTDRNGAAPALSSAPAMFIENTGQSNGRARFEVRSHDRTIWLAEDGIWVVLASSSRLPAAGIPVPDGGVGARAVTLHLSFPGANPHPRLEPFGRLETRVSYFLGNDPAKWRADVPVWSGVRYVNLYAGIDLVVGAAGRKDPSLNQISGYNTRESGGSPLSWRLEAHEGANLSAVRLRVEGAEALALESGRLRLTTAAGEFTLPLLIVAGARAEGQLAASDFTQGTFEVSSPFLSTPALSRPPTQTAGASDLLYATFLGGSSQDWGNGIAVDGAGNAYVTGVTDSSDFPSTPGAFDPTHNGQCDAFVVRVDAAGSSLVYATFLGGSSDDLGFGIAVDGAGNAYVTGETLSSDFPATPAAFDPTYNGIEDAFVAKLDAAGSSLAYATFLGGSGDEWGYRGIAVDGVGNVYVTGYTNSSDFPITPGAFDPTYNGSYDAFVVKVDAAGSGLAYATFLGGSEYDYGNDIAVDGAGNAYVTGKTCSSDFPTTPGAFDPIYNGSYDAFVVKVDAAGSGLAYATFLGGHGNDRGFGIAVDGAGNAYVTGVTADSPYFYNFPSTPGAFDPIHNGLDDAFVAKLDAAGSSLAYATFLGGSSGDGGSGIAVDGTGNAYVTGGTDSSDFPTTPGAFDPTYNGSYDAFVAKIDAAGSSLVYATFLGGSSTDVQGGDCGIVVDGTGNAYVMGETLSSDFPSTPGAFDPTYNGIEDAFVVKLSPSSPGLASISGQVTDISHSPISEVAVSTQGGISTTTDVSGYYTLTGLVAGTYTLTPSLDGYVFGPTVRTISVPPDGTHQDFVLLNPVGDADGDALLDSWEVNGYDSDGDGIPDVALPAMGANPLRKDIFVEIDYMVEYRPCESGVCIAHTHRPKDGAIARVVSAFASAPVSNPDGSTGVTLHVDFGPNTVMDPMTGARWGALSHAEAIPHRDVIQPAGEPWDWSGFDRIKSGQGHFTSNRARIFHYVVFAHDLGGTMPLGVSGISRGIPAGDFIVSLGRWTDHVGTEMEQAGTFMHELGHNLGLHHGGDDDQNFEPNYLSVMNYSFQTKGLVADGNDGLLDYSRFGSIPPLDEHHLNETIGLDGGSTIDGYGTRYYCRPLGIFWSRRVTDANGPIDWNCDLGPGGIDVEANINDGNTWTPDPTLSTLTGFDDWPALVLDGGSIGSSGSSGSSGSTPLAGPTDELTLEVDRSIYCPYCIALSGSSDIVASLGVSDTMFITLTNQGALTATILLSYTAGSGWFNLASIPTSATLVPSDTLSIPVTLTMPSFRSGGISDRVVISATAQGASLMGDWAILAARIGPLARYEAEPVSGRVPLVVAFSDASVGEVTSRLWDFGDGTTSASPNPTHTYTIAGTYAVTLTVGGPDGSDTMVRNGLIRADYEWAVFLPIVLRNQ